MKLEVEIQDGVCQNGNANIPAYIYFLMCFLPAQLTRKCIDQFRWFKDIWNASWADQVQALYKIGETSNGGGGCERPKI